MGGWLVENKSCFSWLLENYLKLLHLYWTSAAAEITQLPQIVLSSSYHVCCSLLHNVLREHTLAHVGQWGAGRSRQAVLRKAAVVSAVWGCLCWDSGRHSPVLTRPHTSGTTRVYIFNFRLCHSLPSPTLYSPFPNFSSACAYDPTVTYIPIL